MFRDSKNVFNRDNAFQDSYKIYLFKQILVGSSLEMIVYLILISLVGFQLNLTQKNSLNIICLQEKATNDV